MSIAGGIRKGEKMVTKRSINELKRNITKDNVSFSRMRGCYVNSEKEILIELNTKFLTLPEEELFKYLNIVQEVFSGAPEEKILTLEIKEEETGGLLKELVSSGLENEAAVQKIYKRIIDCYDYAGNYLILLFRDDYDVLKETANREKLDESETVYSYIICAICPVILTNAGLECSHDKIQPRERDWVVQKPDIGFVWPAFEEREAILNHVMYYASHPLTPQHGVMEGTLSTYSNMFAAEHNKRFEEGIRCIIQNDELTEGYLNAINAELQIIIDKDHEELEKQVRINDDYLKELCDRAKIPEVYIEDIIRDFSKRYKNSKWPKARWLYLKRRVSKFYTAKRQKRMRDLLARSSSALQKIGQLDLAVEITDYLERTR